MSWNKTHSKVLEEKVKRLKEANSELREHIKLLQQPKSCSTCKHWVDLVCRSVLGIGTDSTFYCNRYEKEMR